MALDRVPLADPRSDLAHLRDDILGAMVGVLDSGAFILGPLTQAFEAELARQLRVAGAIGVGCGTDALVLALLAAGVSPGDEVITVSHTAGATVAAIRMIGAVAVLIDIEPATYCMDPQRLEAAIGPRTRAILPVHLYGHPADLGSITAIARRHGVPVIEDCAQAQEARIGDRPVGAIGDLGCFSFYPTKNLGAIGDGGLVVSSSPDLAARLRLLRTYGWSKPQFAEIPGGRCSRLDELQVAVLSVKLRDLPSSIERRREIAHRYNEAFADLPLVLPSEQPGFRHVYHLYVVRSDRRDALAAHLDRAGVATGLHYPHPVHAQPGLAGGARIPEPLRVTDAIASEILTLPLYPSMPRASEDRVIAAVRSFFERS